MAEMVTVRDWTSHFEGLVNPYGNHGYPGDTAILVPIGMTIRFTATPLGGYAFSSWWDGNTDNPRYYTITENLSFWANFGSGPAVPGYFNLTAVAGPGGTVAPNGGSFPMDTDVQVGAVADPGFEFDHWAGGSTDNPLTVFMSSDQSVSAVFKQGAQVVTPYVPELAIVATPYKYEYAATNGTPPLTFQVIRGSLPPGIRMDPATGSLEGTPEAPAS